MWASKIIFLIEVENFPKNPAKSMRATLAFLFNCVCIAHVLKIPSKNEKRNPRK